ncbi:hypothetical protein AF72_11055 [Xylella taiwanensis]|uniref:Uncharacterized protein n=1 Tax=Xylella taiwanensis TaxID=1444770 RepID=Z9JGU3_9GAMM|nr:hypothetical protein AB672_00175 [Xylella taiwanensis]EWS77399.1 hypothetical protein AF72_11055 [Xylella taiwanensis]
MKGYFTTPTFDHPHVQPVTTYPLRLPFGGESPRFGPNESSQQTAKTIVERCDHGMAHVSNEIRVACILVNKHP